MSRALVALMLLGLGCVVEAPYEPPRYAPPPVMVPDDPAGAAYVVADATLEFVPGAGAGYYLTYGTGGRWHVRWTCDSSLTGYACYFDGRIIASPGDQFTNLSAVGLEGTDAVWYGDDLATEIGFATAASVAVDGFDFDATPGTRVTFEMLSIDGAAWTQFVFLPSGHPSVQGDLFAASPLSLPVVLQPTSP